MPATIPTHGEVTNANLQAATATVGKITPTDQIENTSDDADSDATGDDSDRRRLIEDVEQISLRLGTGHDQTQSNKEREELRTIP